MHLGNQFVDRGELALTAQPANEIEPYALVIEITGESEGVGLDRAMIERLLESDADAEDIRARDAHARGRGVSGVPTFVVGSQHVVPGAQPTELWVSVIDELIAARKAEDS